MIQDTQSPEWLCQHCGFESLFPLPYECEECLRAICEKCLIPVSCPVVHYQRLPEPTAMGALWVEVPKDRFMSEFFAVANELRTLDEDTNPGMMDAEQFEPVSEEEIPFDELVELFLGYMADGGEVETSAGDFRILRSAARAYSKVEAKSVLA